MFKYSAVFAITMTWIPRHVGIRGNEMADRIAQHAITNEKCAAGYRPGS